MRFANVVACFVGRPRCYRQREDGIDFAMCRYCHRQAEVHDFGGPRPRPRMVGEGP